MRIPRKKEEFEKAHKHEGLLFFLCFLTSAVVGYILTNHVFLLRI